MQKEKFVVQNVAAQTYKQSLILTAKAQASGNFAFVVF